MKMSQTKAVTTHRVFPAQMNEHDSLYGGQILYWLDEAASVSAHRLARSEMATGAIDQMTFLAPTRLGDAIEYHSIVTGAGGRSMEVFTKAITEDLATGQRTLVATAFSTFVAVPGITLPPLVADDPEGAALAAGYAARKATNTARRQALGAVPLSLN
ncbi:acyl-CoA thioesterase [Lacticaseibacillus daqingensis]|uniref:acyl-CoA thioesterase n=1 Tax=Lacticaseibacillus daqingensis TaxID=2486014 RepID=UPI000F7778F6|nr:acyl-CoA thioesterase [Lacticaseibacillus daqingensis]